MPDLEQRLQALRDEIAWPATPSLGPALEPVVGRRHRRRRAAVLALAVVAVAVAGVLSLSPGARSAFLRVFHVGGATVVQVDELPQAPVQRLPLGRVVDRAEAERRSGFRIVDAGPPDAIHLAGRTVTLVYGPADRPRLLITEGRGKLWEGFLKKVAATDTRVQPVTVDGEPGLFVSGGDHVVMIVDERGQVVDDRTFLAGTVLLWSRGRLLLRLEGDLSRDEAIEVAESLK